MSYRLKCQDMSFLFDVVVSLLHGHCRDRTLNWRMSGLTHTGKVKMVALYIPEGRDTSDEYLIITR